MAFCLLESHVSCHHCDTGVWSGVSRWIESCIQKMMRNVCGLDRPRPLGREPSLLMLCAGTLWTSIGALLQQVHMFALRNHGEIRGWGTASSFRYFRFTSLLLPIVTSELPVTLSVTIMMTIGDLPLCFTKPASSIRVAINRSNKEMLKHP
jgi:hypothetical protein